MRYVVKKGAPHEWRCAYELLGLSEDGHTMEISPVGGGLIKRVPRDSGEILTADDLATRWERKRFGIDGANDETAIDAWTDGRRWNGWAIPLVEMDDLPTLCASWDRVAAQSEYSTRFAWDGHTLRATNNYSDEPEEFVIDPQHVEVAPGDVRTVYDVSCGLIWAEVEG